MVASGSFINNCATDVTIHHQSINLISLSSSLFYIRINSFGLSSVIIICPISNLSMRIMTLISFLLDKKGFVSLVLQIIFIFDANNTLIVIMKNRLHSCQEHSELISDVGDKISLRKGGQGHATPIYTLVHPIHTHEHKPDQLQHQKFAFS